MSAFLPDSCNSVSLRNDHLQTWFRHSDQPKRSSDFCFCVCFCCCCCCGCCFGLVLVFVFYAHLLQSCGRCQWPCNFSWITKILKCMQVSHNFIALLICCAGYFPRCGVQNWLQKPLSYSPGLLKYNHTLLMKTNSWTTKDMGENIRLLASNLAYKLPLLWYLE